MNPTTTSASWAGPDGGRLPAEADAPHAAYIARMIAYREGLRAWSEARRVAEAQARKRAPRQPRPAEAAEAGPKPHWAAKIGPDEVRDIRRRHAAGENRHDLAKAFGLTARSINLISSRRRWATVPDDPA